MISTISQSERDSINYLSYKIDIGTANINDYVEYEKLLIKAGLTKDQIRAKMTANGFLSYQQYLDARNSAKTKEQKYVVNVIVVAGLVVLSAILGLLVATGKLVINEDK